MISRVCERRTQNTRRKCTENTIWPKYVYETVGGPKLSQVSLKLSVIQKHFCPEQGLNQHRLHSMTSARYRYVRGAPFRSIAPPTHCVVCSVAGAFPFKARYGTAPGHSVNQSQSQAVCLARHNLNTTTRALQDKGN
jgi:hypothetical protein